MIAPMDRRDPLIRATHTQNTARVLEEVAPGAREKVLARLDPAIRDGIACAMAGEFVPAEWDLAIVRSIDAVLGREQMRRVARQMMLGQLKGTLLGALVAAARAVFGASPVGLFRWAGKAHGYVTRNCGELALVAGDVRSADLGIRGMPLALRQPIYLEAIAGTLESVFDVCKVEGTVVVAKVLVDGANFRAEWPVSS
jgi:hypothetical protein